MRMRSLPMPCSLYSWEVLVLIFAIQSYSPTSMMRSALLTEAFVSKEKRASTSVETLPGTMFRISLPNWTRRLSSVASTWSSMLSPCFLPQATAASISFSYSGFLEAARISEGLVVASWGLYLSMVAKSPESQTTVYEGC